MRRNDRISDGETAFRKRTANRCTAAAARRRDASAWAPPSLDEETPGEDPGVGPGEIAASSFRSFGPNVERRPLEPVHRALGPLMRR